MTNIGSLTSDETQSYAVTVTQILKWKGQVCDCLVWPEAEEVFNTSRSNKMALLHHHLLDLATLQ